MPPGIVAGHGFSVVNSHWCRVWSVRVLVLKGADGSYQHIARFNGSLYHHSSSLPF
jgi:hypothetical protein